MVYLFFVLKLNFFFDLSLSCRKSLTILLFVR